jgi:hypothetical protein
MTVAEMFEQYRINKAVSDNLWTEIKFMGHEAIEALQLPAYVMSHIPRSETHKIYQPTEQLAIRINTINHQAIKALLELTKEIEKVDNLVQRLNDEEKFVVIEKYINCHSWKEIEQITEKNGMYWTKCTLKIHKKRADVFLQKSIDEQLKIGKFILLESEENK